MMHQTFSRRGFLHAAVGSLAATGILRRESPCAEASSAEAGSLRIIGFTKPLQQFSADETADFVAELGWEGVELPVRAKGHVEPERVEDDLPRFVEAFKKRGLDVSLMATDIKSAAQPLTRKVLQTAAGLGIKRYRLGFWKYAKDKPIADQLTEIQAELRDLAALNKELGVTAGFQNHSGVDYVGAPVWDIWQLIKDLDPNQIGCCFDIGHATLEGGYSWPIHARLMRPFYTAVYLKDFLWSKGDRGWRAEWRPLGDGMVDRAFFQTLKESGWSGIISQHHEYELPKGRTELFEVMRKDVKVLREWLA